MFSGIRRVSLGAILAVSLVAPAVALTPTPSPTPAQTATDVCVGDCNGDGTVRVNELIVGVNIALGSVYLSACPAAECPQPLPGVFVNCAVEAVVNALSGCPGAPPATPAPSRGPDDFFPTPYALSSLDEHCGEETGAGLLAAVRSQYTGALTPRPETGWDGPIAFTVRLTYGGGAITCYPRYVPYSERPVIFEQVGLIVQVEFDTADGRFAENVETELRGDRHGGNLSFGRRPNEIQGTYRPDLPGYEDVQVGVWGNFFGDWTNGGINQTGQRPEHASEYIPLAYWQQPKTDPPPHR